MLTVVTFGRGKWTFLQSSLKITEPIYVECEAEAAQNCVRIRRLTDRIYEEFDPTHAAVLEALGRIADPSRLTPKQQRILAFLENEYNL